MYYPTRGIGSIFVGTLGLFLPCMFLFLRVLPAIRFRSLTMREAHCCHEEEVKHA